MPQASTNAPHSRRHVISQKSTHIMQTSQLTLIGLLLNDLQFYYFAFSKNNYSNDL